jgi:protein ImuB
MAPADHKMSSVPHERRIAAVVLPELLIELGSAGLRVTARARKTGAKRALPPLAVVLAETDEAAELASTARLDAVNDVARHFGVREGQSIAEARALIAELGVRRVSRAAALSALGRVAEAALAFGATVSIASPDTVWVDVTGSAHLKGGEAALAAELASTVRGMGHAARVAVSSGPRLARAFARWTSVAVTASGECSVRVVPGAQTAAAFSELPLVALPLDAERAAWFARLGVLTVGDLAKLPRASAAARLGPAAGEVLELCAGRDPAPLAAYALPSCPVEETSWDDPLSGIQPLLFVLRGLASRLSARLAGRGEAAQTLELVIGYDRSIARLRGAPPELRLHFALASPLWREAELRRVVASRLERTRLGAPTLGLRLEAPAVVRAIGRQLDLSRVSGGVLAGARGLESLPVLLAELGADIGPEQLGVLALRDAHRPEAKSVLVPARLESEPRPRLSYYSRKSARHARIFGSSSSASEASDGRGGAERPFAAKAALEKARRRDAAPPAASLPRAPTRLLPRPVPLDAPLAKGALVSLEQRLYSIEKVEFEHRLCAVEWWSPAPVARDYLRLWLAGPEGGFEALAFVDRNTGKRFLHAVAD